MNVYLIKASSGSEYSKYKAQTGGPPQNIFSVAACSPSWVELEMCDETIGMKTNFKSKAEVVAIFMSTPDALRAYEIADKFRKKGKMVVLGGLHTLFMKEEAQRHADSVLLGEAEGIWEELLNDYVGGNLKPQYQRTSPMDLSGLKPYPAHLIKPSKYNYTWSVLVSRGCPNRCEFCLVHKFFDSFRYRPIPDIVAEIKSLKEWGVEWVELHSDNLTQDKKYVLELFKALEPLNMKFFGETTILIARDEELLKAAYRAGVRALLFGIETPSEEALMAQGKSFVKPEQIKEYVAIVKSYGIEVWGDFLFGFDEHDEHIFQQTLDFVDQIKVDKVFPHLMIPFPGSNTFNRLDSDGRILSYDWSEYDGSHVVYQPALLNPEDLENGLWWFYQKQNSLFRKIGKLLHNT